MLKIDSSNSSFFRSLLRLTRIWVLHLLKAQEIAGAILEMKLTSLTFDQGIIWLNENSCFYRNLIIMATTNK